MAVVGEGTVVVRLVRNVFRRDLQEELNQSERDADKSGARSGDNFAQRFGQRLRAMDDSVLARLRGIEGRSSDSGDASGAGFGSRFSARLGALDDRVLGMFKNWGRAGDRGGDDSGGGFVSRFSSRLRALDDRAASIFTGFRRSAENAGDDAGSSFKTRFLSRISNFGDESRVMFDDAGNALQQSFSKIKVDLPDFGGDFAGKLVALIPLIGVLGGGLSALVGGLGAVAAAAVYAAGSLAVLAAGVGALGLGLVTGFLAFSGITKALQALNYQQNSAASGATSNAQSQKAAADAIIAAQQRVQEAIYSLAQARKNAAEQSVQDEHSVADAEYALQQAQQSARDAQLALTQAREDAKSKLEDLQLQLRGSVISEEEATLRLQKARQAYQTTLNNPAATEMDREQARLDLEQAELAVDEATKRNQDLQKQTEDANKKGVEGSDQVVAAKQKVKDANHSVAEAEYSLAQARQRQADDALKSQHDITRAIQEVASAQRALAAAQEKTATGGVSAANRVKRAMAGLTPEAAKFARELFALKPLLQQLQNAAGSQLFGPLMADIKALVAPGSFFGALKAVVAETGRGIAQFFHEITVAMTSSDYLKNFQDFAKGLTAIKNGVSDWGLIGRVIGNLLKAFTGLATASEPLFRRLLTWLDDLTAGWAAAFNTPTGVKKMTDELGRMGDAAAIIFGMFGDLWQLLKDVFGLGGSKSGVAAGIGIIQDFDNAIKNLDRRLRTADGIKGLQHYFNAIRGPIRAVGGFIGELAKQFLILGENGTLTRIFDDLKKALPTVEHAIETFTNKVAPPLVSIITTIIQVFDEIASSPAFSVFVNIMKVVAVVIGGFIKVLFADKIRVFTGAILGLVAAIVALNKVAKITGLKGLAQSIKVGAAEAGTERATSATGIGSFIQGARGNRVEDPGSRLLDDKGKPVTGSGKARLSNRLGFVFNGVGDRFRRTPPERERPPGEDLGDFFDPRPGRHTTTPRRTLRSRLRGRLGGDRGFATGRAAGVAGAVATVGLAIAPALIHGNIKGLKEAAKNIGHTLTSNMGLIVATAAPGIIGKLFSGEALGAVKKFGGIAKSAAGGVFTLGKAMFALLGPWGLVIAGIALLVAGLILLYKHSKLFRDIVNDVWNVLKTFALFIVNIVIKTFDFMKDHLQLLLLVLGPIGIAVLGVIEIFKHWDDVKKIVGAVVDAIVGFFTALPGRLLALVKVIWSAAASLGSTIFNGAVNAVTGIASKIGSLIGGIPGAILGSLKAIGSAALSIGQTIWSNLWSGLKATGGFIANVGTTIINTIVDFLNHNVIDQINHALRDISIVGHRPFGRHTLPDIPRIGGNGPSGLTANAPGSNVRSGNAYAAASGATVAARPGGTLVTVAEAGKPESIVDTGLINQRLRLDEAERGDVVSELRRVQDLLRMIQQMGGINVEKLEVQAHPDERAAESVPRSLRELAFQMGA